MYERFVSTVKNALKTTLHCKRLSEEELRTVLLELSFWINLRPLMALEDGTALTPAHFVFGCSPGAILDPAADRENAEDLTGAWRARTKVTDNLRARWTSEYLPTLRAWRRPRRGMPERQPEPGDLVLVQEDGLPRRSWALAKIVSLIVGVDGHARAAKLIIRGRETRRALERLFLLEACPCL